MPGPQALHLPGPPRGRATSALALRRRSDRLLALTDAWSLPSRPRTRAVCCCTATSPSAGPATRWSP